MGESPTTNGGSHFFFKYVLKDKIGKPLYERKDDQIMSENVYVHKSILGQNTTVHIFSALMIFFKA